ncbi:MAG: ABC transporter ATP-binding protein [Sphaerochaeta sp.]|nr:ABC transporter ATP-binding protein [Sphaerochaeta sp.]
MSLLEMKNITKTFFGKCANQGVNLTVGHSEIHALLGENGAGKTTLMNILYGIYQADGGEVFLDREPILITSPKVAIAHRIGMVHQHFTLVPTLTVSENITLGLKSPGYPFVNRRFLDDKIRTLSQRYGLEVDPTALVSTLSVGQQQRVEIMKLLYREAELLILDEPTAVLTPQEVQSFFTVLRRLRSEGHSVIIITHHIEEVLAITDCVTVLRNGCNAGDVETSRTSKEELSMLMIGRKLQREQRQAFVCPQNRTGLVVTDVALKDGRMGPVSLSIGPGKIFGIAGVDGNGQKELAELILGIRKSQGGSVSLDDVSLDQLCIQKRKDLGIGYISDDRLADSLVIDMGLMENMLLKLHSKKSVKRYGLLDWKALQVHTEQAVQEYQIKTSSLSCPVRLLSGGNQQKLILAREMEGNPRLVVACQPTRGLDIGASEAVHKILLALRSEGCSVLLISADLEEILELSDDIAVMHGGSIMDVIPNRDVDLTYVGLLMAGAKPRGEL